MSTANLPTCEMVYDVSVWYTLSLSSPPSYAPRGTRGNKVTQTRLVPQCSKLDDLMQNATDMFRRLGPHLHTDPVLLCKLVRLGRAYLKETLSGSGGGGASLSARHLEKVNSRNGTVQVCSWLMLPYNDSQLSLFLIRVSWGILCPCLTTWSYLLSRCYPAIQEWLKRCGQCWNSSPTRQG